MADVLKSLVVCSCKFEVKKYSRLGAMRVSSTCSEIGLGGKYNQYLIRMLGEKVCLAFFILSEMGWSGVGGSEWDVVGGGRWLEVG